MTRINPDRSERHPTLSALAGMGTPFSAIAVNGLWEAPSKYEIVPDHPDIGFLVEQVCSTKVLGMFQKAERVCPFGEVKPIAELEAGRQ